MDFEIASGSFSLEFSHLKVYTTRPDTIFGVDFMVIAPEHELVPQITIEEQKAEVEKYLQYVNSRSERERMAEKDFRGFQRGVLHSSVQRKKNSCLDQ